MKINVHILEKYISARLCVTVMHNSDSRIGIDPRNDSTFVWNGNQNWNEKCEEDLESGWNQELFADWNRNQNQAFRIRLESELRHCQN